MNPILKLYHREIRENPDVWEDGMRVERVDGVVRIVATHADPSSNMILCTNLREAFADEAIKQQSNYFNDLGHAFEWKVYGYDVPADLSERLLRAGFEPQGKETLVAVEASTLKANDLDPVYEVRRITTEAELDDLFEVIYSVYGDRDSHLRNSLSDQMKKMPDRLSVFGVFQAKRALACAWTLYGQSKHFAGLFGGTVLKEFRGRGLYRALVAARAAEACERGCQYLTVDAAPTSCPTLLRMGFLALTEMQGFVKHPVKGIEH